MNPVSNAACEYLDEEKLQLNKADKFEKLLFGETLEIAASSDSDLAAARALRWLRHCIDNHERCRMGDSGFLPRRLLRIAFPTSDQVSVVDTDASAPLDYAALSYCWGEDTSGVVTTVQAKLAAHAQGIAVSTLPRTVQDAITVCTRLGVSHLWVDALCIVQDDTDDWRCESSRMMDIYANAVVTVAAVEPDSCKKGFLGPQRFGSPDWQRRITVDVPPGLDRQPPADHLFTGPGQVPPMRQSSLDARGWCLQERVLPRRRLAFEGREMSWHCLETVMCECGHLDQSSCGEYAELKTRRREELAVTASGRDAGSIKADVAALNDEWLELMEEYSRRFLTRSSDKLVAISGLAGLFQRMLATAGPLDCREMHIMQRIEHLRIEFASPSHPLPGNYLAGMWKSCLLPSMAWVVDQRALLRSGRGPRARYKEYCAPSWSWASVNGPVKFRLLEEEAGRVTRGASQRPRLVWDTVVENLCCTPVVPTLPHGALKSAFVVLTGDIIPVELAAIHNSDDTASLEFLRDLELRGHGIGGVGDWKMPCFARTSDLRTYRILLDVEQPHLMLDRASPQLTCWRESRCLGVDRPGTCCAWDPSAGYACLRFASLCQNMSGVEGDKDDSDAFCGWTIFCLVLRRVSHTANTYERVGLGIWDLYMAVRPGSDLRMFTHAKTETIKLI